MRGNHMDFLHKLKKSMTQAGQTAVDKAKKTADILKLKEQIRQDKRELRDITYKIGKTYISLHKNDYEKDYEKYFISMDQIKKSLTEKEKELQKMHERMHCAECGNEISSSDDYCPECGTAVAVDAELKEEKTIDFPEEDIEEDLYEEE